MQNKVSKNRGDVNWSIIPSACGNPPPIEHATVDKVGNNHVLSVRAYTCGKGFIATGPIEVKCVEDKQYGVPYWILVTDNKCIGIII